VVTNLAVGQGPVAVEVVDVNGDKVPDVVVANGDSDDVTVWTNANVKGAMRLVAAGNYGVPSAVPSLGLHPQALALANFVKNSALENHLDLAVLLRQPGQALGHVAVMRGNGTNSLNGTLPVFEFYWFDPGAYFEVGTEPMALASGDFNGDKLPDLAVANFGSDDVSILLNNWTPKAYNQKLTFVEDYPTNIVLGGSYGPLDYILTVWPTNGTITPSNNTDLVNLTANPVLLYTPFPDHFGKDLIKYYVSDGTKTSKWATLAITLLPVNDPPVISNKVGDLGVVEVGEDLPVKVTNFINYAWPGPWGEQRQTLKYFLVAEDRKSVV
jgi:hypothetical protein